MKPQTPRKKVKDTPGRTAPEIPPDILPLPLTTEIFAAPEISLRECLIEEISFKDRSLRSVLLKPAF